MTRELLFTKHSILALSFPSKCGQRHCQCAKNTQKSEADISKETQKEGPVDFIVHLVIDASVFDRVREAQASFELAARECAGHVRSQVHELETDLSGVASLAAIHSFDTTEHLVRWLESDDRKRLVAQFQRAFGDHVRVSYPTELAGFTAWFTPGCQAESSGEVPRWKMNLIVLVVLYPLTLTLVKYMPHWLPNADRPTLQLLVATIAVSAMGFLLIPLMGRVFGRWLKTRHLGAHIFGASLLGAMLYLTWHIAHWVL